MKIKIRTDQTIPFIVNDIKSTLGACNTNRKDIHGLVCAPNVYCRKNCRIITIEIKEEDK